MIFSLEAHTHAIRSELVLKPKMVWISSFGANTGVGVKGGIYDRSPTYEILTATARTPERSRVLIGVPSHSTTSYVSKLTNNAEVFTKLSWRYSLNNHLKVWIFFHRRRTTALFGGRNLGDSAWNDASIWLRPVEVKQLVCQFENYWSQAQVVPVTKGFEITDSQRKF